MIHARQCQDSEPMDIDVVLAMDTAKASRQDEQARSWCKVHK